MWVLVLILVVLVLLLGLGYARLLSALKDLQEQIQKKLQSGSGVRLTSQLSKKELVALTKQVSDLFDQIERTNRIAFQEKKTLDMAISNIAHDIRTPLTIASGYTQQIIKGGTQEEEKLKKIASNLQVVSKRLESLLEYRRLMEGAIQPRISDVNLSQVLTQQLFQYYDSLSEAGITLELSLIHIYVGIAMGSGTDIAIESGGIVLTQNDLLGVVRAFDMSPVSYTHLDVYKRQVIISR